MNEIEITSDMKLNVRELVRANPDVEFTLPMLYEFFGADDEEAATMRATIRSSAALLAREPDSGVSKVRRGVYARTRSQSGERGIGA